MNAHGKFASTQPGQTRASLYGAPVTRKGGGIEHADKLGTNLAMRPAQPPPVAEYDQYLKSRNVRFSETNHRTQITGFRLRRIVVMRRQGATWKECGAAVGLSASSAQIWTEFLPLALAV